MKNEKEVKEILEQLKADNKKKFKQSVDLMVSFKDINLKNPDEHVELYPQLHYGTGKVKKILALVDAELEVEAKKTCDKVVTLAEFPKLQKKDIKKLAADHDWVIGQANIMPKIAQTMGRYFGPRGKMPNPKAGCIVPPKANLSPIIEKLQKTIKIVVKKQPNLQLLVGKEDQPIEELMDNIKIVYDQLIHHLPKEKNNIKDIKLKLTMSKAISIN